MMPSFRQVIWLALVLVTSVVASPARDDALDAYPDCAVDCLREAFAGELCAPEDQKCVCSDDKDSPFKQNVTTCVQAACTIPDVLAATNVSLTNCNAPIRDRSHQLNTISISFLTVASICVAARIGYKLWAKLLPLGLDDWLILATLFLGAMPGALINTQGLTPHGLGRDIWTLSREQITTVLMWFYIMAVLYFWVTALVKMSLIAFYLRIFPARGTQRLLWGSFIFTAVWGIVYIIGAGVQCQPVSYFWTQWDGLHEGKCLDAHAIAWSNAAINIALDVWIMAIPLWELKSLQLHWKKKIGVALMFSVGIFVAIMSILRLRSLVAFSNSPNKTWEFFDVSVWSAIEACVSIICACLPHIRLFLVRLFPILASVSSGGSYYNKRSRTGGLSRHTLEQRNGNSTQITAGRKHDEEGGGGRVPGISFQKTVTVEVDTDEVSLVSLNVSSSPDHISQDQNSRDRSLDRQ